MNFSFSRLRALLDHWWAPAWKGQPQHQQPHGSHRAPQGMYFILCPLWQLLKMGKSCWERRALQRAWCSHFICIHRNPVLCHGSLQCWGGMSSPHPMWVWDVLGRESFGIPDCLWRQHCSAPDWSFRTYLWPYHSKRQQWDFELKYSIISCPGSGANPR